MPDWLLIPLGLLVLMGSGDALVRGVAALAIAAGVRPMLVGATIVAFGTSAPELAASLIAAVEGTAGLATGTVFGSNVANLWLILGTAALIQPVRMASDSARFEVRCLVALTVLTPLPFLLGGRVTRLEGLGLLAFLAWFTWRMVRREVRDRREREPVELPQPEGGRGLYVLLALVGLVGLPLGAHWLVEGARSVAATAGVSPQVIGAAVVAVGTSLPELAASVAAAMRGHPEIALGNVLGSNLFNLGMVLGATAVVRPLPFTLAGDGPHVLTGLLATLAVALAMRLRGHLGRGVGAVFLGSYGVYVAAVVARG